MLGEGRPQRLGLQKMHTSNSLRFRRSQRPRRRYFAAAIVVAAAVTGCFATSASAIDAPAAISCDPHSPRVAELANVALDAKETFDANPTADTERAYDVALADLAAATGHEMSLSTAALEAAWQRADSPHQTAVLTALTQLGVPYRSNSSEPLVGFDCSGLTSFAWREAGVQLSRQSGAQISEAEERTEDTAMAGDLAQYPGHVMLYLGVPGAIVHASNPQNDVELWLLGDRSVNFGDPSGLPAYVDPAPEAPAGGGNTVLLAASGTSPV
jgi:cell wall-associated NlpC family hydrolase